MPPIGKWRSGGGLPVRLLLLLVQFWGDLGKACIHMQRRKAGPSPMCPYVHPHVHVHTQTHKLLRSHSCQPPRCHPETLTVPGREENRDVSWHYLLRLSKEGVRKDKTVYDKLVRVAEILSCPRVGVYWDQPPCLSSEPWNTPMMCWQGKPNPYNPHFPWSWHSHLLMESHIA